MPIRCCKFFCWNYWTIRSHLFVNYLAIGCNHWILHPHIAPLKSCLMINIYYLRIKVMVDRNFVAIYFHNKKRQNLYILVDLVNFFWFHCLKGLIHADILSQYDHFSYQKEIPSPTLSFSCWMTTWNA